MIAAVICPQSPLLVESFDRSGLAEMLPIRQAARSAVASLVASGPARVVVLADVAIDEDETAGGDLSPWGVPVAAGGTRATLGLAHTVGAWLLDDAGWTGPRAYVGALETLRPDDAILVMADGTTKRTERAPGHFDDRAEGFDLSVEHALERGDAAALESLDIDAARDVGAESVAMLTALGRATNATGQLPRATLLLADAPLGVGYWVALWEMTTEATR